MNKLLQSKKRGSAIALVVVAVLALLAMGMGLLSLGSNSRIYSIRIASEIAARCAADSGLEKALFEMNEKLKVKTWNGSILPQAKNEKMPYCDEVLSYTISGDPTSGYVITSLGKSGQAERTVIATIGLKGLFDNAILTKNTLILKPSTHVDGYNSLYPLDTDTDADIGSQSILGSCIVLNSGVTIEGDVVVGIGGDPDTAIKDLGATTGNRYAMTEIDPLPLISPPSDLLNMGTAISASGQTVTITPVDNGAYTGINLAQSDTPGALEISGGDVVLHITGDIEVGNSCEIIVKDGSSLTIYIDGNIHCHNDCAINSECPPENPTKLKLYATGEDEQFFDIKAKSNWSGIIYAPNADIDLYAKGDFYGSIVADNFELKAGGNFHYDKALKNNVSIDDEGVRFIVKRWREE